MPEVLIEKASPVDEGAELSDEDLGEPLREGGQDALTRILPEFLAAGDERRKRIMGIVGQVLNRSPPTPTGA